MEVLTTILVGIIIAAASAWITVQLSLRRFRTEKWWERRVAAYERVIEALHQAKSFSSAHLDALATHSEVSDERHTELAARSRKGRQEIERARDVGGFILSQEASERLHRYLVEAENAKNTHEWHTHLEADWKATNDCLKDIIQIAKEDLKTR